MIEEDNESSIENGNKVLIQLLTDVQGNRYYYMSISWYSSFSIQKKQFIILFQILVIMVHQTLLVLEQKTCV